jgi:hypothetical protein
MSGGYNEKQMFKNHKVLRDKLQKKVGGGGQLLLNLIVKAIRKFKIFSFAFGMNKGRSNDEDIKNAKLFAEKLLN